MEVKGTLKYRKVQRTPQTGENAGKKKWYATSVTDREVDFEGFVSHISDHGSPYSRGTIHGVLMDALDHLQELILDGKSVRLSDLGLFSIGMSSKAEDTKEKVTAASVEGVHLIVRNTKSWSNTELRKKCKIQEYGGYIGTDGEGTTGGGTTGGGTEQGGGSDTSQGGSGTTGGGTEQGGDGLEQSPRLRAALARSQRIPPLSQHSTLNIQHSNYESKYLENDFADCNLRPYSHRYYARSYQLQPLKVKK